MAQVPATQNSTSVQLKPFGQALTAKFKGLERVDTATFEESIGLLLEGKYLARAIGWDNTVFCAYLAQRDRLAQAGAQVDMDSMLGKPGRGTALRQILKVDLATNLHAAERSVRCRVPADSKALTPFAAFLNEAVAKIVNEDALGQVPSTPQYFAVGVGQDIESVSGHSPKLKAVLAEKLKALQAPSA